MTPTEIANLIIAERLPVDSESRAALREMAGEYLEMRAIMGAHTGGFKFPNGSKVYPDEAGKEPRIGVWRAKTIEQYVRNPVRVLQAKLDDEAMHFYNIHLKHFAVSYSSIPERVWWEIGQRHAADKLKRPVPCKKCAEREEAE